MLKEEAEGWRQRVESVSMEKEALSERHESLKLAVSEMTAQLRIMTRRYNKMRSKNEEYKRHLDTTLSVQMAKQQDTIRNYHHQLVAIKEKYDILYTQYLEKNEVIKEWRTKYNRLTLDFDQFVNGNSDENPNGVINGDRVRPSDLFGRCKLLERRAAEKEERLRHLARSIYGLYQDTLPLIGGHLEEDRNRHSHDHDARSSRVRGDDDDDLDDDEQDEGPRVRTVHRERDRNLTRDLTHDLNRKLSRNPDRNRSRRLIDDQGSDSEDGDSEEEDSSSDDGQDTDQVVMRSVYNSNSGHSHSANSRNSKRKTKDNPNALKMRTVTIYDSH